ncbi:MAG TPA: LLM class flavin-dependent oxidoreductase [Stellaceae bacterium]|nr:LLM class flavin-dependent oxidoreductase [Stellaceae bacterium]
MKAALFCTARYMGPAAHDVWPAPADRYSPEIAERSMATTMDQFRLADEYGFDWVTVAEHHFAPMSLTPNPMLMAAALTQTVKRAKIAVLGPTLPLLNPVRVAEEFAMLDTMSGGRLIAGMMRGTPNEYVTYNINPSESRARFEEAVALIRMAWTEKQPFGWQGRYYKYRSVSVWPRPVQQPHPPIYVSGSSPESGGYAARNRFGLGLAFTTLPLAEKSVAHYRASARKAGWEPKPDDIIYRVGVHVADTDEQAFADMAEGPPHTGLSMRNRAVESAVAESGFYGSDFEGQRNRLAPRDLRERVALGQLLVGSPETVAEQIRTIHAALGNGVIDLPLSTQLGARTLHAVELFGSKVLPRIRELQ